MVQLVIGNKGKGKTRWLLNKVNEEIKETPGNICYLDKSSKHMFDLNNKIRLINVADFMIENTDQFLGFVSGIISQDHDLVQMYFDAFMKISHLEGKDISEFSRAIIKLQQLDKVFDVDFILGVTMDEHEVPEEFRDLIAVSL